MADGYIQVPPDSTGKKIDTSEITVGANTVERHRINISDPLVDTAVAPVTSSGGLGVTILSGAAAGSTSVHIIGSSSAIAPVTSSGGLSVTIVAGAALSTVVSLSSHPTVNVSSGLISVTSGTITLSSAVAISSGTVTLSSNHTVISASSGNVGTFASTGTQYSVFTFNSSSSNSITNVSTGTVVLFGWNTGNESTGLPASVKLYNSTGPTVGSTTDLQITIPLPGSTAGSGNNKWLPQGVLFSSGLSFVITANFSATSTGSRAAGDVVGTLYYI